LRSPYASFLHVAELDDASVRLEHGGDDTDAAQDGAFAEPSDQGLDVPHAVEEWHDHGVGADSGSDIGKGALPARKP